MAREPNPDRDERFSMPGVDPVDALRALLQVDPDAEPVDDERADEDKSHGPRRAWGSVADEGRERE